MAVTTTTRFGITRWSDGADNFNRLQMDDSHAAIENKGAIYLQSLAASRPIAGVVGRFHYATDTKDLSYDNGTSWQVVGTDLTVYALATTTISAGNGLTGGGNISANRTLSVNFSTTNPIMAGTASPGTANTVSRGDHIHQADTSRAPIASPTFTGTPAAPTASADTNTTQLATTAFVVGQAGSATPIVNGTAAVGTSLRYARQDHVHGTDTSRAALASPTFTGTPAAPTAAVDTNTTQLATTAFVLGQASSTNPAAPGTVAVGTSTRYARADHVHAVPTASQIPTLDSTKIPTVVRNAQTTSYTLVLDDAGKLIEMGSGSAQTLTVPLNSSTPFPIGTAITVVQTGAGQVTFAPTSGVTINSLSSQLKTAAQWAGATLIKRGTDTWVLLGALSA